MKRHLDAIESLYTKAVEVNDILRGNCVSLQVENNNLTAAVLEMSSALKNYEEVVRNFSMVYADVSNEARAWLEIDKGREAKLALDNADKNLKTVIIQRA